MNKWKRDELITKAVNKLVDAAYNSGWQSGATEKSPEDIERKAYGRRIPGLIEKRTTARDELVAQIEQLAAERFENGYDEGRGK